MVFCCVPYCQSSSKTKEEGVSFHEFPSKLELREKWLRVISRKDFVVNDNTPRASVICSKHFKEEDYIPGLKIKRLCRNAVPSIFPNYPSYMVPKSVCKRVKVSRTNVNNLKISVDRCNPNQGTKRKYNESNDNEKNSSSSMQKDNISNVEENLSSVEVSLKSPERNFAEILLEKTKKENRFLKKKLSLVNTKVQKLEKELKTLREKLEYFENNTYHSALENILKEDSDENSYFILQQIENYFPSRPTWNEKVIRTCVLWHSCSPKGYNFLRNKKILKLPSKLTLQRYIGPFTGEEGFTALIKERLLEECSNLNKFERFCSLIIDEMAIKQSLIFDAKVDCFFGYQTNTDFTSTSSQLANKLLSFVIRGLSTSYRIPCAYFFTKQLTGKELYDLTLKVLSEVEKCGFIIIRIVADNFKVNTTTFRILGKGKLKHKIVHPYDETRFIFLSFDQNHIIKNIRSQFLEREMADEEGIISGKYVKFLYALQQNENIKAVRNLTKRHVEPSNIDKMNVGRAVLIFSPPVTAAITFLKENFSNEKAYEFKDAESSVNFMKNIYKWFSIHDVASCEEHLRMRNNDKRHFFSINDERLEWLQNFFLPYLDSIKEASSKKGLSFLTKETHEALVLTTNSTTECIKYLLNIGYHYVLTRAFNSDPIESLFSALRQMNGGNDMMDVRSTLTSMEKILKTGILVTSKASNVGESDGLICSTIVQKKDITASAPRLSTLPLEILQILDGLHTEQESPKTDLRFASIAIVCGYLIRVIKCTKNCIECLSNIQTDDFNAPIFGLILNQDRGGLSYPKPAFIYLISVIMDFVEKAVPLLGKSGIVKNLYFYVYEKLLKSPVWKCDKDDHKQNICSIICSKFIPIVVKNISKTTTDKIYSKKFTYSLSRKYKKLT